MEGIRKQVFFFFLKALTNSVKYLEFLWSWWRSITFSVHVHANVLSKNLRFRDHENATNYWRLSFSFWQSILNKAKHLSGDTFSLLGVPRVAVKSVYSQTSVFCPLCLTVDLYFEKSPSFWGPLFRKHRRFYTTDAFFATRVNARKF